MSAVTRIRSAIGHGDPHAAEQLLPLVSDDLRRAAQKLANEKPQIRDEMIVADLDASLLTAARSHPNCTLRTRRAELFGELVRDQVVS